MKKVEVSEPIVTGVSPAEDREPFLLKPKSKKEIADYDEGFKAGYYGRPNDDTKSVAWQKGWAEAQE